MSAKSTNPVHARELQAEHQELRDFFQEGTELLADPNWAVDDFFSLLAVLRRHLQEHFEHEEQGGYFREAILVSPQLAPRAAALLQQHARFMATVDQLIAAVGTELVTTAVRIEVIAEWQRFYGEFHQHEAGEVDLLQLVFNEDLGAGD